MRFPSLCCHGAAAVFAELIKKNLKEIKESASTCGDIFPDASDRDGGPFYSVPISILHHPLYPPVDLSPHTPKPPYFLLFKDTLFLSLSLLVLAASLTPTHRLHETEQSFFISLPLRVKLLLRWEFVAAELHGDLQTVGV